MIENLPTYSSNARERRGVLTALALVWTGWSFPADYLRTIHLRVHLRILCYLCVKEKI